ncbi:MAG: hypothetical protein RSE94_11705 [Pseudomonas sp.]
MNDTPEMKLARALKAAAAEYCEETGRTFDPRFEFVDVTPRTGLIPRYHIRMVVVSHTQETVA